MKSIPRFFLSPIILMAAALMAQAEPQRLNFVLLYADDLGYGDFKSYWPYLQDRSKESPRTTLVHNTFEDRYAIRDGDWVLIDHSIGTDRQASEAWMKKHKVPPCTGLKVGLYNLKDDLGQRHNLADKHPEKVGDLQKLLQSIRAGSHTSPRSRQ